VGLRGFETRYITVGEEYGLWASGERTLRGMYGRGRREAAGECRKLNNEHLQISCFSFSVKKLW
jgi:hypothetical protein